MRCLVRNKQQFYYCLYDPSIEYAVIDADGNETGELVPQYSTAVGETANISPATGTAQVEQFGNLENYDKVIVLDDVDCPIDEHTVLFVDKDPEYTEIQTHKIVEGSALYEDDEIAVVTYQLPKHDYIVKRVAKSLNSVSIAIRKVDVS